MYLLLFSQLTFAGMNSQDEKVALQAIEFWSTVCEEEISIKEHLRDVSVMLHMLITQTLKPFLVCRLKSWMKSLTASYLASLIVLWATSCLFFCGFLQSRRRMSMKTNGMNLWLLLLACLYSLNACVTPLCHISSHSLKPTFKILTGDIAKPLLCHSAVSWMDRTRRCSHP